MFYRKIFFLVVVVTFLGIFTGCDDKTKALNKSSVSFAQNAWVKIDDTDKAGFSSKSLKKLKEYCKTLNTTGLMVIYRGKVLFEYGDIKKVSYIASVRKSVLAMIYGIYVNNGTIDLSKNLEQLGMDDIGGLLPVEKKATVEHLISARSGVYHLASNPGDNLADAPERGSKEPGTYYLYSNWDFNAAGGAFEKITGKDIFDVVNEELVKPLEMEDFTRSMHEKGGDLSRSVYPSYHMYFSTRDMARIGRLMLNKGRYNGKQIIPAEWVKKSTSLITHSKDMNPGFYKNGEFGYGYMWWVWDPANCRRELHGAYCARGAFGQYITVIPSMNIVIAHKTAVPPRKHVEWSDYRTVVDMIIDSKVK